MRTVFPLSFLILILVAPLFSQEKVSPEKELALALIKAESKEEQNQILAANKSLLTIELRKALIAEGNEFRLRSEFAKAMEVFQLAQNVSNQMNDEAGVGYALRGIGIVDSVQGNATSALTFFQQSLAIAQKVNDRSLEAGSLRSIGIAEHDLGNIDKALEAFQDGLIIAEELQDKAQIAANLNNIGTTYMYQGNYRLAMSYLEKSLALRNEVANKEIIASNLNNMAIIHDSQGNYPQALEFYRQSLKLREEIGDKSSIANLLNNMGDYRLLGDYDSALEYNNKSLALAEELGDQRLIARAWSNIANAYLGKKDLDRALEYGLRCLALTEKLDYPEVAANTQKHVANAYFLKGEYEKSLEYAQLAVATAREIGDRQPLWMGLEASGKAHRAMNQPDKAQHDFEEAITTIEDWRYLVAGGELEQQSLFAQKVSPYHEMIDLLVAQSSTGKALEYSERAKARVLLDVIRSGRVNIESAMSAQEQSREQEWNQKLVSIQKEIQSASENNPLDQALLANLNKNLQSTRLEWEAFRTQLYVSHPELKVKRGEISPISVRNAVDLLPDSQTAFLEYAVTDEMVFLFVLTRENPVNVYKIAIQQESLSQKVKAFREKIANRDSGFRSPAIELYQLLLFPAAHELEQITKLVIVPDGALWELPFQALITPKKRYLLEEKTVSFTASLTVLQEMMNPQNKMTASPNILAFGNPALGKNTLEQLHSLYRGSNLDPLPEAEKEAKQLGQLYGDQHSKVYIGAEAQEGRFKAEASQFRILHLATHSILNDSSPMYSQIVLAQTGIDQREDGLLEAREVLNMSLSANIVILSSCESALGKVGRGEGMIGLAWAFFVAGTSTTIVSQWKVASASTTEFMLAFHEKLKSEPKAEALRSAALGLSKQNRYRHPFYWAPFVLIGNRM